MRHVVGRAADLAPGGRLIVVLEGRSIGVFNVGGELFALRNTCPHQGGPLCRGTLSGLLTAPAPGEYRYERRGEVLRCPWHGWEFDIRTGRSLVDPELVRVRTYPVSVESGQVLLEL
jgi:3-phenylpropionate/trans-cinnamate dioxygenase ferredoxin subunit